MTACKWQQFLWFLGWLPEPQECLRIPLNIEDISCQASFTEKVSMYKRRADLHRGQLSYNMTQKPVVLLQRIHDQDSSQTPTGRGQQANLWSWRTNEVNQGGCWKPLWYFRCLCNLCHINFFWLKWDKTTKRLKERIGVAWFGHLKWQLMLARRFSKLFYNYWVLRTLLLMEMNGSQEIHLI